MAPRRRLRIGSRRTRCYMKMGRQFSFTCRRLRPLAGVFAGLALGLLAACSTPDARIRRNQALFDSLPATEQALIREGKVGVGFTPEMVRLAVGDPDQRWVRTEAGGRSEIWSYTTYDGFDGAPLYRGYYHRYHGGYPFFYDGFYHGSARPREYFKVTFVNGKVTAVEQDLR
jgi:hypothetical protein